MSTFRLFILGPAQFSRDNQPITLNAAKTNAVLAYLAVTGVHQTREVLADLLWPDSLPEAGRKNLRNTLWSIRKTLGDDVLLTDTDQLMLADTVWSDVRIFEATIQTLLAEAAPAMDEIQAAADLYRAPLLDGLTLWDAPNFETWLTIERERFGQLYLRALEMLVAAHRSKGNWQGVITSAQQALDYDNLQEPMYRALMEGHARLGKRREALRIYDTLRTTLAGELSVEPLAETEALHSMILTGGILANEQQSGQVSPSVTPGPSRSRPGGERVRASDLPFIGRKAERIALEEELQRAASGQARVALLTGELGIGKSRLWQSWSVTLSSSLVVLETRCLDTSQSLPFAPLIRMFSQPVFTERLFKPPSSIAPIWLAELARLIPEIRQLRPEVPRPTNLPPEEERRRLFEAFTQALRALESQPLVLFIDDLHWIDQATLDWLIHLVDRMGQESLLLVGSYRASDAPAQLIHRVASWGRESVIRHLPLAQLTLKETTELVTAMGGDTTLAEQLHVKSAGNPYFLIELNRAAPDGTPPVLIELIRERVNRLPEAARQILQAAAVLETEVDFAMLRRISGRSEEETLNALDALLEADMLIEAESGYEFTHPLVAAVIGDNLSLARRSFLHRRAAEGLEAIHAGRLTPIAGRLAAHYAQAGRPTPAARYTELAAEHAAKLGTSTEAVTLYRQALLLEPTPTRYMGLGWASFAQGDLDSAREAFHKAAAGFESEGNRAGVAQAHVTLAGSYMASGQGDMVIHWAEEALLNLDIQFDPETKAQAHLMLSSGGLLTKRPLAEAEEHLTHAIQLAAENDLSEIAARGQFALGKLLAERGDLSEALRTFDQSITLAHAIGYHYDEVLGHNNLAYHALLADDLVTARKHIEIGLALAEEHSLFLPGQYLYSTRGEIALAEGALDEAEMWFKRGLSEAEQHDNVVQAINIRANLGLVARERGDLDQALNLLTEAYQTVVDLAASHLQTQIDLWLAELHLQRGEQTAAKEALTRAEARLEGDERKGLQMWARRVRAELGQW